MTELRPFTDADYESVTEIHNLIYANDPFSANEWRYWDESRDPEHFQQRLTVHTDDGTLVGWAELGHIPEQFSPTTYNIEVSIDPGFRRQGHGAAAYNHLLAIFDERGGKQLRCWVKESEPDALVFVANRGFSERRREWQSRLDIAGFDPAPFAAAVERMATEGITLTNLAEEQARNPDALRDAYELNEVIERDVPNLEDYTPCTFEHYLKTIIEAPDAIAEAHLIARDGDGYVGLARMMGSEYDDTVLYQGLTGVIPSHRGRGIATALKMATVDCARALGKREITTWNDTNNRGMLRINEAMGFVKEPAEIVFVRDLHPPTTPE